ncbi:MAG: hypothetical protein KF858_03010 [Candidatus Sumerlaeia bacterium]|nr:hypothetical protein [Candidatus Sumerlaeia bacterium]
MSQRMRLLRRIVVAVAAALVALAIAARMALPGVVRGQLERRLSEALAVPVTIGDVDLGLLTGRVALEDIAIANPPGHGEDDLLTIRRVEARVPLIGLTADTLLVERIEIDGVRGRLARRSGQPSNLEALRALREREREDRDTERDATRPRGEKRRDVRVYDDSTPIIFEARVRDVQVEFEMLSGRRAGRVRIGAEELALTHGESPFLPGLPGVLEAAGLDVDLERRGQAGPLLRIASLRFVGEEVFAPGIVASATLGRSELHLLYDEETHSTLRHARRVVSEVLEESDDEEDAAEADAVQQSRAQASARGESDRSRRSSPAFRLRRLVLDEPLALHLAFVRGAVVREVPLCALTGEMQLDDVSVLRLASGAGCSGQDIRIALRVEPDGTGDFEVALRSFPFHAIVWMDEPPRADERLAEVGSALLDTSIVGAWSPTGFRAAGDVRFHDIEAREDRRPLLERLRGLGGSSRDRGGWGTILSRLATGEERATPAVPVALEVEGAPPPFFFLWSMWKTELHEALVRAASEPAGSP